MATCTHPDSKLNGHDRHGRQRYRCVDCGKTWGAASNERGRISKLSEQLIEDLIPTGMGVREIAFRAGVCKETVRKRLPRAVFKVPAEHVDASGCDHCGAVIGDGKDREFFRRTSRLKHKFCDHACYTAFYLRLRGRSVCKLCRTERGEANHPTTWNRGYCGKCYTAMRLFGFDEAAAEVYRLSVLLKKEIQNGQRLRNQKYV